MTSHINTYSGKKKYVNPLELPAFLHEFVIILDLILIQVTRMDKHSVLKLITHTFLYFFFVYIEYII